MLPTLLALALFPPAPAEGAFAPKGPPPAVRPAVLDKDGALLVTYHAVVLVPVTMRVQENVNGMVVTKTVTTYQKEIRVMQRKQSLEKATFSEAGGKKLDKEALGRRLAKPAPVLFSQDGKPIDPAYLKLFKKDLVVITLPASPVVAPAPKGIETIRQPPAPPVKK
jgi:hypothetical protein